MKNKKRFSAYIKFFVPGIFLVFILFCSRSPGLSEAYMQRCYPVIAAVLSSVSQIVPFSLLDLLIIAAIVAFLGGIAMMCFRKLAFRCWINIFSLSLLWIIIWFYMAWGIGYFRPDFHTRFGIEQPKGAGDFFEAFVIRYIDSLNLAYTADRHFDAKEIDDEIERLYENMHEQLQLPFPCGVRRTKCTLTELLMTRMGVAGYFDPFFNEVQVNNFLLPADYPFTLAHEKAHQFGITSEAECNLYASVICTASNHPLIRYSGYLQTVSYLLGNLRKISPDNYREIYERIDSLVIADYRMSRERWQKALNPALSAAQSKVYDSYLKTNKQQSGIQSYSEMVGLLIAWEQAKNE